MICNDLVDEPDSLVHGVITGERTFEGHIRVGNERFSVERASTYFRQSGSSDDVDFHSVIYRDDDIEHFKIKGDAKCPWESFKDVQKNLTATKNPGSHWVEETDHKHAHETEEEISEAPSGGHGAKNRGRRAIDDAKQQCTLYMEADVTYYDYYGGDELAVIEQFIIHVQAVNAIYELVGE